METFTLPVIKDVATIAVYGIGIIGGIYGFFKWIYPKVYPFFRHQYYYHETGVHVIKDIELHFGKEAGRVLRDIMKQRGLEITIDEMRLNIIENAIGLGIFICNSDGKCTYANKTLAKMFGLSQHEMLGFGWLGPIIDKQTAYDNWKFSVDHGTPYRDMYDVRIADVTKTYTAEAEPSLDEEKRITLGFVGVVKEKTEPTNDSIPIIKAQ